MECEKCHKSPAYFTGSSKSFGPDASDAENTKENLPGGFAWLCQECWIDIAMDEMEKASAAEAVERDAYEGKLQAVGKHPSFRAIHGRAPVGGKDYDIEKPMCQDDYEFYTGTGAYSDYATPADNTVPDETPLGEKYGGE